MTKNILLMTYMKMLALFCATIGTTTYGMYSRHLQDDEVEVTIDRGSYCVKAIAKKPRPNPVFATRPIGFEAPVAGQALEKQFRSVPTDLCDKIKHAEQVVLQLNIGKAYMSNSQLQQSRNILSECQEAITTHLSQQALNKLTQPVRIYATQTTTDLTLLRTFLGIITSMITGIDGNLAINTASNQAILDIFLESQKDNSLQEIGNNTCFLYVAQTQHDEQRAALQAEVKTLKSGVKDALAMAKICSGGITPDNVYELIYDTTEFVKRCNGICEYDKTSNNQKTNSFIQDAVAKATEIRQKEEAISELSKTIELLDLKITSGAQLYLQNLAAAVANLDSKSLQDLIQLRDVVYQVGITANNLAEQLCQTCENLHIDLNQHEQYNAGLNLIAIFDKSKEIFDRINQIAEMRNQKLPCLPEPQAANLTTTSHIVGYNAILQRIDKPAAKIQSEPILEIPSIQQQVYVIGVSTDGHEVKTENTYEKSVKDRPMDGTDSAARNNDKPNPVATTANNPDYLGMSIHAALPTHIVEEKILNNRTQEIFDSAVRLDEHVQQHNGIRARLAAIAQHIGKYVSLGAGIGFGGLALRKVIRTWRNVGFKPASRQALVFTGITGILCSLLYRYTPKAINRLFTDRCTRRIRRQLDIDDQAIRQSTITLRNDARAVEERRYIQTRLAAFNRLDGNGHRLQTKLAQQKYAETIAYF